MFIEGLNETGVVPRISETWFLVDFGRFHRPSQSVYRYVCLNDAPERKRLSGTTTSYSLVKNVKTKHTACARTRPEFAPDGLDSTIKVRIHLYAHVRVYVYRMQRLEKEILLSVSLYFLRTGNTFRKRETCGLCIKYDYAGVERTTGPIYVYVYRRESGPNNNRRLPEPAKRV